MTKKQFDERHPDGMNKMAVVLKKSLHEIMTTEEIDNVIAISRGREKRWLKAFKNMYFEKYTEWDDIPIIPTLLVAKSALLLSDVITFAMWKYKEVFEDDLYHGEGEDNEL